MNNPNTPGVAYFVEEDIESVVKSNMYLNYPYDELRDALNSSGHSFLINVNNLHNNGTQQPVQQQQQQQQQQLQQQQNYQLSYLSGNGGTPTSPSTVPQQNKFAYQPIKYDQAQTNQYQQFSNSSDASLFQQSPYNNGHRQQQPHIQTNMFKQEQDSMYGTQQVGHIMSPVESLTHQVNNTSFLSSPESNYVTVPMVTSYDLDGDNLFEDSYNTPTDILSSSTTLNGGSSNSLNSFGQFPSQRQLQSPMRDSPIMTNLQNPDTASTPSATVNGKTRSLLSLILPKRKKSIQQRKVVEEEQKESAAALVRRTSGDHLFNSTMERRTSSESGVAKFAKKVGRHDSAPVIGSLTVLNRADQHSELSFNNLTKDEKILVEKPVDKRSKGKGRAPNQFVFVLKRNASGSAKK
jgi:hypothetical protein